MTGGVLTLVNGETFRHSLDLNRMEELQQIGDVTLVSHCEKLPFSHLQP